MLNYKYRINSVFFDRIFNLYFFFYLLYNKFGDFMLYTSTSNKFIKEVKKLTDKKYRDKTDLFLVEGEHLIIEAYRKGFLTKAILKEGLTLDINFNCDSATDNVLNYISEMKNTTCIGICKKKQGIITGDKILILDGIQDPGNLGTIIRSCVAFNINTIILSPDSVDVYNPKVVRATQGMIFNINILYLPIVNEINKLKNTGYKIYGTKVTGGESLSNFEIDKKFAIIMGNEGKGVSDSILNMCDKYIYIPMKNNVESLNVAIATSIILYELGD